MEYCLGKYPLWIEPTVTVLEITGGESPDSQGWVTLQRVPTHTVYTQLSGLPAGLAHFFGLSSSLAESKFLLAYDVGGRICNVLNRVDAHDWNITDIPIERTGEPVLYPSARLVFKTERARMQFVQYLQGILDRKSVHPTLALALEQLAEPIRMLEVWGDHEG